jgi:hypothetical protein
VIVRALACLWLSGCFSISLGRWVTPAGDPRERLRLFVTSEEDLHDLLGAPESDIAVSDGQRVLTYIQVTSRFWGPAYELRLLHLWVYQGKVIGYSFLDDAAPRRVAPSKEALALVRNKEAALTIFGEPDEIYRCPLEHKEHCMGGDEVWGWYITHPRTVGKVEVAAAELLAAFAGEAAVAPPSLDTFTPAP